MLFPSFVPLFFLCTVSSWFNIPRVACYQLEAPIDYFLYGRENGYIFGLADEEPLALPADMTLGLAASFS